ncbi:hypothetical protein FQN55_002149 [Onygenales sp. PD_40]|nr:hypothetical protein FQN55_002149 [Onygenales sp. PD_40]
MSDSRAQTGGVRSLLARFENNNNNNSSSTSPPSRGRSPIDSTRPDSVRPLSKVRASFVAVERTGQPGGSPMWGLRKASEIGDSPGKPRTSVDEVGSPMERSVTMSSNESVENKGGMMGRSPDSTGNNGYLGNRPWATKVPSRLMDSPTPGKQSTPGDTLSVATTAAEQKPEQELGKTLKESPFDSSAPSNAPEGDSQTNKANDTAAPTAGVNGKPTEKVPPKKTATNPPSRSSNAAVASKKTSNDSRSPPLPRTPRTPATAPSHTTSKTSANTAKEPEKGQPKHAVKKPSRATLNPTTRGTSRTQSSVAGGDNAISRNVRGRTRSPARPARLPNSMVAPTAASAAKFSLDGRPASRPSSRAGTTTANTTRKPSSLRTDRTTTASRTTSTVQNQPSRASLAPPQNTAHDRPRSRNTGTRPADESFLARMMRPTASSASKVHEKLEIKSPPRGSGSRPPKARRKSGESASSHGSTPPSSAKKIVKKAPSVEAETEGNVGVEVQNDKEPEPVAIPEAVVEEPVAEEPALEETAVEEPAAVEPTVEEPSAEAPTVPEPVAEEPAIEEPPVEEPEVQEPVIEPAVAEPVIEEPAVKEHVVEETAVEEPAVEEPAVEEPAVEEPAVEEPAVEEPAVEEPAVEDPAAEEPVVEAPVPEEATAAAEPAKEAAVEGPAADEPAVEAPAVNVPVVEESPRSVSLPDEEEL